MKWKGSVTVFAALSLMLTASFLFALFEAGRVYMLEAYADMTSELALESVCAEYQPALWEKYHLLCLDGAYGGKNFSMEYTDGVLRQRINRNIDTEGLKGNLLAMKLKTVEAEEYQLLTDQEGSVFLNHAASYMKSYFPIEAAELLYQNYTQREEMEKETPVEDSVENAQKAIREARENQKKEMDTSNEGEVSGGAEESAEVKENPLEMVLALKQNAILGMVVEDMEGLSNHQVNLANCLMNRKCQTGNSATDKNVEWYEKVLALEYLDKYYGSYVNPKENQALSYEMEYVLCGRETDKENLEKAVERLMLLREAANVVHIVGDGAKREEALALANALAGFSGNPAVIKVVQIGIIGAWAYMESILDVRALLQGNKIALQKSEEQWTLNLTSLGEMFQSTLKAKNCENGCSYQTYLKMLLYVQKEKLLAYRMMDVIEQNARLIPQQQDCRMDHMICKMTYRMTYQAETIFMKSHGMEYAKVKEFSYE